MGKRAKIRTLTAVSMVSLILTSCGVGVDSGNTTEQIKDNLTVAEQSDDKTVYNFDRLGDGSDAFVLEVESANSNSKVRVLMEDEVIIEDNVEFDKAAQVYTAENDIYMEVSQLNEDNSEYVFYESETPTDTDAFKFTTIEDYDKVEKMNYGKRLKIEEVEISEIEGYENYEGEYEKAVKITYLDLGDSEVETEEDTTEPTSETTVTTKEDTEEVTTEVENEKPVVSPPVPSSNSSNSGGTTAGSVYPNTTDDTNVSNVTPTPNTVTPPTTAEPPTTTTTEATTETHNECTHNWVEVINYDYVADYSEDICLYCGYTTRDTSDIINHCVSCGGVWTHEELAHLLGTENEDWYYTQIGTPRGSSYTTKTHYKEIPVHTGQFYCDKCYTVKR